TNITHEFRTPLTVIQGVANQIEGNEEALNLIRRNSKNLLRLVNQLLDMSKIESSKMKLELNRGDIVSFLAYLTESFRSYADSKGIRLHFSAEMEVLVIDYDAEKVQHVLSNLVSNAIKFSSEDGQVTVKVWSNPAQPIVGQKLQLFIRVEDQGVGVKEADLPYIFDRFYQADSAFSRKGEGTGIGLALAKELVELMGGTIDVQSTESKGTQFAIILPVEKVFDPSATAMIQAHREAGPEVFVPPYASGGKRKPAGQAGNQDLPILLIIEDNPDVVQYLIMELEADYEVHAAPDGQQGIEQALEIIPDIIISDVMMPEKDGYEVTAFLKNDERTSHIPIILLTAKADAESKLEGLIRGADAYLAKPFERKELLVRLENLVELRKKLQDRYSQSSPPKPSEDIGLQLEDAFLNKVREAVQHELDNADFGVSELCRTLGMSQSQLCRKIKALTGRSIASYIRSIRLYNGYELLLSTNLTVSEVAYEVGFTDPNYFSKTFVKEFGVLPSEVARK
ncbi:MAG: response regulator, partial [Phaeodactylibacter sp.]|nr:response regulator [Phaeodactylibacter sp.]